MDLRAWLLDAHHDLRSRLFGGVVNRIPPAQWHDHADGGGSSVTWLLLHLARHQDLALRTVIRDAPPLFLDHRSALALETADVAAGLSEREELAVSAAVRADPLLDYVNAVFTATEDWMDRVSSMAMDTIPDAAHRLHHHALLDPSSLGWLFDMWSGRTVQWFVQWPVLGHGQAHLGEAIAIRNRLGLSPH